MATATRRTRKSADAPFGFKADGTPRKRPVPTWLNSDKKDVTTTSKEQKVKEQPKVKPVAKRQEREQDSVTVTMIRGKRDRQTGEIDQTWMPSSNGGVRFEENVTDGWRSPEYVDQDDFEAMGRPVKIRKTLKALA
jgi:hypothetical protein